MSAPSPFTPRSFLVVLTGAGISAESGVPTFRSNGGLWRTHRFQDLATPEAFTRDRRLVWEFYQWRQAGVKTATPNQGHRILAQMEQVLGERFLLVTQNVDDLHERGGSRQVLHMHGELMKARCLRCGTVHADYDYREAEAPCPTCRAPAALRPHIVWFGEIPFHLEEISAALRRVTHFLAIGTSGAVHPAAGFVDAARRAGARTALVNLDPADNRGAFHRIHQGGAGEVLARLWAQGPEGLGAAFE